MAGREHTKGTTRRRYRGPQHAPTKHPINIRLDATIVDYYRATGKGWQTRLNDDLAILVTRRVRTHTRKTGRHGAGRKERRS